MSLEIISTNITRQAKEILEGSTVLYNYQFVGEGNPTVVIFQVFRGLEGSENYTGIPAITGSFTNNNFDIKNKSFQSSDGAILAGIHSTCDSLVNPE